MIAILYRVEEDEKEYMKYYIDALENAGAKDIDFVDSDMLESKVDKVLNSASGLLITGYSDPTWLDIYMVEHAVKYNKPLFAICQGIQDMGIYSKEPVESVVNHMHLDKKHEKVHFVNISRNSVLYNIIGETRIGVNSCHNNMVLFNKSWDVVGVSDDGVVEAMENSEHMFQIGVQWHPEMLMDDCSKKLFAEFVRVCHKLEK